MSGKGELLGEADDVEPMRQQVLERGRHALLVALKLDAKFAALLADPLLGRVELAVEHLQLGCVACGLKEAFVDAQSNSLLGVEQVHDTRVDQLLCQRGAGS